MMEKRIIISPPYKNSFWGKSDPKKPAMGKVSALANITAEHSLPN